MCSLWLVTAVPIAVPFQVGELRVKSTLFVTDTFTIKSPFVRSGTVKAKEIGEASFAVTCSALPTYSKVPPVAV